MRRSFIRLLVAIPVFLLFMSCASLGGSGQGAAADYQTIPAVSIEGYGDTNRLTLNGTSLSLPQGWNFTSGAGDENDVVFSFSDPSEKLYGRILFLPLGFTVSAFDFMENYRDRMFPNIEPRESFSVENDGIRVPCFRISAGGKDRVFGFSASGEAGYILGFEIDSRSYGQHEKTIKRILASWYPTPLPLIERKREGAFTSVSTPKSWIWIGDVDNGAVFAEDGRQFRYTAALWKDDADMNSFLETEVKDASPETLKGNVFFNNALLPAEGAFFPGSGSPAELFLTFIYREKRYWLSFRVLSLEEKSDPQKILESEEVLELTGACLYLTPGR